MATSTVFAPDEQPFLDAIRAAPDDLTTHLVYAEWLDDHGHRDRGAALRAWAALVRLPITLAGMDEHFEAYNDYREALVAEEAEWIEAVERVRPWVPKPLAEAIFRLLLNEQYGDEPSVTWSLTVSGCLFDNRWSGQYAGTLADASGQPVEYEGRFFLDQITGHCSGHVTRV